MLEVDLAGQRVCDCPYGHRKWPKRQRHFRRIR